jgi:hypothetical protein
MPNTRSTRAMRQKLGVNVSDLLISQPDTGEQALEIADMLVRSSAVDVIVIDSVAALTPKAEIEGEMGDSHVGLQARLMSQALRKLTANIKRTNTLVIFINQIRMKIGVMFGSPETTTGGNALKFYASVRLDIRRIGAIKKGDEVVGSETKVKVVKNKVAPPFKEAISTSSTARASPARARSSSWASPTSSSTSPAPGMPTRARRSARARTTRANTCASIRKSPRKSKPRFVSLAHARAGRHGSLRLKAELRDKGVPDDLTGEVLAQARAGDLEAAREVWRRKFGHPPADAAERGRQVRFLAAEDFREVIRGHWRRRG